MNMSKRLGDLEAAVGIANSGDLDSRLASLTKRVGRLVVLARTRFPACRGCPIRLLGMPSRPPVCSWCAKDHEAGKLAPRETIALAPFPGEVGEQSPCGDGAAGLGW